MRRILAGLTHLALVASWGYFEISLLRLLLHMAGIEIALPFELATPGNVPSGGAGMAMVAFATAVWTWMGWPLISASKKTPEYVTEPCEGGGIVITRSAESRRTLYGRLVRFTFVEFGFVAWVLRNKAFPKEFAILLGVACVLATAGYFFEHESWRVAPNLYEHRRTIFGWTYWRRRIADGTLMLSTYAAECDVFVRDVRGRRKMATSSNSRADVETYGELVARATGWKLDREKA